MDEREVMTHLRHQLTKEVKLLQKVVLTSTDQKILLLQRSADSFSRPECWDLPGGNSEWPESMGSGVVQRHLHLTDLSREIIEETGLHIEVMSKPHTYSPIYFDTIFEPTTRTYTILVGWKFQVSAEQVRQGIKLSREHQLFAWATLDEALRYDFGFAGGKSGFITQILLSAQ